MFDLKDQCPLCLEEWDEEPWIGDILICNTEECHMKSYAEMSNYRWQFYFKPEHCETKYKSRNDTYSTWNIQDMVDYFEL